MVFNFSFFILNPQKNLLSILILATILSIFEYIRGYLFGGFPWNLIAFSFVNYLEFIQILSITGTYTFNSLVILLFLFPIVLFFNYKIKIKISIFIFSLFNFSINFFLRKSFLKEFELTK